MNTRLQHQHLVELHPDRAWMPSRFYESEKPTCIYCHGTAALADLKLSDGSYLVNGKTVTGFSNGEEDYSDRFVGTTV